MKYDYRQGIEYYLKTYGFLAVMLFLYKEEYMQMFSAKTEIQVDAILIGATLIALLAPLLAAYVLKNIYVQTDKDGLTFNSLLKKIRINWDEIKTVSRVNGKVEVANSNKKFTFAPIMRPEASNQKYAEKGNVYRKSKLLQEIKSKAPNAKFEGFPEGTFDEIDKDIPKRGLGK